MGGRLVSVAVPLLFIMFLFIVFLMISASWLEFDKQMARARLVGVGYEPDPAGCLVWARVRVMVGMDVYEVGIPFNMSGYCWLVEALAEPEPLIMNCINGSVVWAGNSSYVITGFPDGEAALVVVADVVNATFEPVGSVPGGDCRVTTVTRHVIAYSEPVPPELLVWRAGEGGVWIPPHLRLIGYRPAEVTEEVSIGHHAYLQVVRTAPQAPAYTYLLLYSSPLVFLGVIVLLVVVARREVGKP